MAELIKFGKIDVFKFGSNDFINPIIIKGNVKISGIIKFFRSIKKIITKEIINIISSREVSDKPKFKKIKRNEIIPRTSTIRY
jgi:hypothetical protein